MRRAFVIGCVMVLAASIAHGETVVNHERTAYVPSSRQAPSRPEETGAGSNLPADDFYILEMDGPGMEAASDAGNPHMKEGTFKGIRYCDSVYRIKEKWKADSGYEVIVRKQNAKNEESTAKYYSFIVKCSEENGEKLVFSRENPPVLAMRQGGFFERISFSRVWQAAPQSIMLQMKWDTLEKIFRADEVQLIMKGEGSKAVVFDIPSHVVRQWKMVVEKDL